MDVAIIGQPERHGGKGEQRMDKKKGVKEGQGIEIRERESDTGRFSSNAAYNSCLLTNSITIPD